MDRVNGFPLFLLGMVLLPTEQTALHVFEERYRDLAARCLENDEPFGIVLTDDSGEPSEFGCATRITEVLQRYDDGRVDILVTGEKPIRLVDLESRFSYPSAVVEPLDDIPGTPGDDDQAIRTRQEFAKLIDALGADAVDPEVLADLSSYEMAARLNLDVHDKQALIESRDEGGRMALLERIFASAQTAAKDARELSDIAQTNGHGKHV